MADIAETQAVLERLHNFDTSTLSRTQELGSQMSFDTAVPAADRLISFFKGIPIDDVRSLPDQVVDAIMNQATNVTKTLGEILSFSVAQENAAAIRQQLINKLPADYNQAFKSLSHVVAFLGAQASNRERLQEEFRQTVSKISKEWRETTAELQDTASKDAAQIEALKNEAGSALESIRNALAEQGVSQQATYFKEEADKHEASATTWRNTTIWAAVILVAYSLVVAFVWRGSDEVYSIVQSSLSKILIFGVLSYLLLLSARNYIAYQHNAIVSRHRQNALLTFESLVKAAGQDEAKDLVLAQAAGAIFAHQETGYTRTSSDQGAGSIAAVASIARLLRRDSTT